MLWIRRGSLLAVGFLFSGCMLACLCQQAASQQMLGKAAVPLPAPVEGTHLVAVELAGYDGPDLEAGSAEELAEVSALVVRNDGADLVASGVITLELAGKTFQYEVSMLPPGATALVVEKNQSRVFLAVPERCYGWASAWDESREALVTVGEVDMDTLALTNHTGNRMGRVRLLFKNYDAQSGMYIGGICYEATVENLLPGQTQQVSPYYYVKGYSRVVAAELIP